ncbi:hypothetical protein BGY98DRAFT_935079 [Russula aff. rugulosa BPL654]|nr:hypothetical protein BGY98DRAFT_935079 [Russula aff. rugulosa BPL654]
MASGIRININKKAKLRHAIAHGNATEFKIINGTDAERVLLTVNAVTTPRANVRFEFPQLPGAHTLRSLSQLFGPWGSLCLRWEMEARSNLTFEGCLEMDGTLDVGWPGWVDAKTGDPVDDKDICGRYEKEIMSHPGARFFGELLLSPNYDPKDNVFNSSVELIHDLEAFAS